MNVRPIVFDIKLQMLRMREHLDNIIFTLTGVDARKVPQSKQRDLYIKHMTVHYLIGESNNQYQSVKIDDDVLVYPNQSLISNVIKYLTSLDLDSLQRYSLDPSNDEGEELFEIVVDDLYCQLDDDKSFISLPELNNKYCYQAACQGTMLLFYPIVAETTKSKDNLEDVLRELKSLIERNEKTRTLWNAILEINEREDELERINEMEGLAKQRPLMSVQPIYIPLWQPVELKDFYNNDFKVFPNIDTFSYGTTQYHPNIISLYHGLGR